MDSKTWSKLEQLFHEAVQLPEEELSSFLKNVDHTHPDLAGDLHNLLHSHSDSDTFLVEDSLNDQIIQPGETIGPWKIRHEIGRGGMSTVYLAERSDGQFERTVAIKFLHGIMPGQKMHSRLRTEQHILAQLEHKNIARLFDAGLTELGRPYFILEYVDGEPLDHYCNSRNLTLQERLTLFEQICEAVQYAHQRLIVHRDLKPSNIMVRKDGTVKLLDFGIAKILEESPSDNSLPVTRTGIHMMTPEFASPEQINGEQITTATDVYALGLLLCLILTGKLPYTFSHKSPLAIGQVITASQPTKPSLLVTRKTNPGTNSENAHRILSTKSLRKKLKGDLDNIVLKALRKEPERRYQSAEKLISDIFNYKNNLPVSARPESALYRLQKMISRHRLGFAATVLILVSLISSALFSAWQADQARIEAQKALATSNFLAELFSAVDPRDRGPDVRVTDLMDQAVLRLDESFTNQPDVEAYLRHTLGVTYRELGLYQQSSDQLKKAVTLRERSTGGSTYERLQSQNELGTTFIYLGDYAAADSVLSLAYEVAISQNKPDNVLIADITGNLGHVLYRFGDLEGSLEMHQKNVDMRMAQENPDSIEIGASLGNVAVVLADLGQFDEAIRRMKQQEKIYRNLLGPNNTRLGRVMINMASVYRDLEQPDSALTANYKAVDIFDTSVGPEHPEYAWALGDLGNTLTDLNRLEEAEEMLFTSLNIYKEAFGETHPRTSVAHIRLGRIYFRNKKNDLALKEYEEAIRIAQLNDYPEDSKLIMDAKSFISEIRQ